MPQEAQSQSRNPCPRLPAIAMEGAGLKNGPATVFFGCGLEIAAVWQSIWLAVPFSVLRAPSVVLHLIFNGQPLAREPCRQRWRQTQLASELNASLNLAACRWRHVTCGEHFEAAPPGARFPHCRKIVLQIGRPMSFAATECNRAGWEQIATMAEQAIHQLAGRGAKPEPDPAEGD